MRDFVHKIPIEVLLKILRLLIPPRTREGMHLLLEFTHVCRLWKAALVNQPHMWSTIFATRKDCRGFVELCVERSRATTLDVTVDASGCGLVHLDCTCDNDGWGRLLHNERSPCEWHFVFESLATPEHSKRIRRLDVDFSDFYGGQKVELALGSCQFFVLSFPHLTSLGWKVWWTKHPKYTFSRSPFTPTIHSLSFNGPWDDFFTQANNLTSLTFSTHRDVDATAFGLFLSNNQSLESLSLDSLYFRGDFNGSPVDLPNLKSLTLKYCPPSLSTIVHTPAIRHLSALQFSLEEVEDSGVVMLTATRDGFTISIKSTISNVAKLWQGLTQDARPTIRYVRYWEWSDTRDDEGIDDGSAIIPLLADAHTLELGRGYLRWWYPGFLDDLKQLGPQVKTIRFEIPEDTEPFKERLDVYQRRGGKLLDQIEELVKYRFEQGRPFSVVERMVVSESGRVNRLQDYVWRCFYGDRELSRYVRPE